MKKRKKAMRSLAANNLEDATVAPPRAFAIVRSDESRIGAYSKTYDGGVREWGAFLRARVMKRAEMFVAWRFLCVPGMKPESAKARP